MTNGADAVRETPVVTRRRFVKLAGALGVAVGLGWEGTVRGPRDLGFSEHEVGAPRGRAPLTLAQLTDLHLKGIGGVHRRIASELARVRPDLIVLTGDAVDSTGALRHLRRFLAMLPPAPLLAILGNWEYWGRVDLDALRGVYAEAGADLLVDRTVVRELRGRRVAVTGVDDLVGGRPDLRAALRDAPREAELRLLLAHCPAHRDRLARDAAEVRVGDDVRVLGADPAALDLDLVLSGHTHGGQVQVAGWAPVLPPGSGGYVEGWFRGDGLPPTYVCRGVGTSILPVRLGAPPEVAVFRIH